MTELETMLCRLAADFDESSYPSDVYLDMLERVRLACSPAELSNALALGLAWKDGKVRRDPNGAGVVHNSGARYRISATRPNTRGSRHLPILASEPFFAWAARIRNATTFDPSLIRDIHKFGLWSTMVMPAFLLHCLNPNVYPIVDRWVMHAYLELADKRHDESPIVTMSTYVAYRTWWAQLLTSMGRAPGSVSVESLKEIDGGLWVFGKQMAKAARRGRKRRGKGDNDGSGTHSESFKELCFTLHKGGMSQRKAMEEAAARLNVRLKPSHLAYPGSHFHRWRRQGFV